MTFSSLTRSSTDISGQIAATLGQVGQPTDPYNPVPSTALAEAKLYLPGATDFVAIGRFYAPNPAQPGDPYKFDGHLVPALTQSVTWPSQPSDPYRFVGFFFVAPNPI